MRYLLIMILGICLLIDNRQIMIMNDHLDLCGKAIKIMHANLQESDKKIKNLSFEIDILTERTNNEDNAHPRPNHR